MNSQNQAFDLAADLPVGRLAIEASAGTGKTYALASLAARYVAEQGVTTSELLVVTFTRAATAELRARVRARLSEAAEHLRRVLMDPSSIATNVIPDRLLEHLADTDDHERSRRLNHLDQAITEFDAATITTIHGFAVQVLASLGASSGAGGATTLVDGRREEAIEASADVLAAAASGAGPGGRHIEAEHLPKFRELVTGVSIAVNNPGLLLLPTDKDEAAPPSAVVLAELVDAAVDLIRARHRADGVRSFSEILTDLRDALHGPAGESAAATVAARYRVALIDEFQDTDPIQWDIFSRLFDGPQRTGSLVLVGDPKQAIYAFRGANIHTYLHAVTSGTGDVRSLATNWRSDGAVLTALDTLLQGATFGDANIAFSPVQAALAHVDQRLVDAAAQPLPALSIRLALGEDLERRTIGNPRQLAVDVALDAVYDDLVASVRNLLDGARIPPSDKEPDGRLVRPSDIAVLVKQGAEAEAVQAALVEQGIPAVLARGASVLQAPAATQWRWLLEALARPSDPGRARTFALSWFGGHSAEWVAEVGEDALAVLQDRLAGWAEALGTDGVNHLIRVVWAESAVAARVLARPDGDRDLTDLDHIAELLRTGAPASRSVVALLDVLAVDPVEDPLVEFEGDVASRRVESDAEAVQVMTVWVAKGLEFAITCCPTLWRKRRAGEVLYQDHELERRALDLAKGKGWPNDQEAAERLLTSASESLGEDLRLLYVALTRARHQTILWWSRAGDNDTGALARVLFARDPDGHLDPEHFGRPHVTLPPDDTTAQILRDWFDTSGDELAIDIHGKAPSWTNRWQSPEATRDEQPLAIAHLDRPPDRSSQRWSFTAVTARAVESHHHDVDTVESMTGAPDGPVATVGGTDEATPDGAVDTAGDFDSILHSAEVGGDRAPFTGGRFDDPTISPMASLPAGATFGTLVHAVLEHVDFADADLPATVRDELGRQLSRRLVDLTPLGPSDASRELGRTLLVEGIVAATQTPLGPLFGDRTLATIGRSDRRDEMAFELRLAGGGSPATDRDIGRLVSRHLSADDPFASWAEQLSAGAFDVELAGHLTGSIDAVLRVVPPGEEARYVVVDYKTNRLHDRGEAPEPDDYAPARVAEAMVEHHYPLQALLYSVALHRYLRGRVADYDPERHLGGAAYLFVRGMSGPCVATTDSAPHGVASWAVPPALVSDLSDLLHGHRSEIRP